MQIRTVEKPTWKVRPIPVGCKYSLLWSAPADSLPVISELNSDL